jgi:hypothetical protein
LWLLSFSPFYSQCRSQDVPIHEKIPLSFDFAAVALPIAGCNAGIPPQARQFPGLVELASATVRPPIEGGLFSPMGVMLPWESVFTFDFWACSLIAFCPEASPIALSSFVSACYGYAFAQNRGFYNQTYFPQGPSSRHAFEAPDRMQ